MHLFGFAPRILSLFFKLNVGYSHVAKETNKQIYRVPV